MQRFEYRFDRVKVPSGFWGSFGTEYQDVVERHASDGWRFVQAYAPSLGVHGVSHYADLIFERPVEPRTGAA